MDSNITSLKSFCLYLLFRYASINLRHSQKMTLIILPHNDWCICLSNYNMIPIKQVSCLFHLYLPRAMPDILNNILKNMLANKYFSGVLPSLILTLFYNSYYKMEPALQMPCLLQNQAVPVILAYVFWSYFSCLHFSHFTF